MFGNYSLSSLFIPTNWKGIPKLTVLLILFSLFGQQSWGQTTLLTDPGLTYGDSDGPTGPDVYSVDVSNCTSVSFSVDYSFSFDWLGSGNMESSDECNFTGFPCQGDPTTPNLGDCNSCWDFLWAVFNIDGVNVGGDLIGEAGTTNLEQSGTISSGFICTNGASNADITVVTQTWGSTESVTFSNIAILCYEAAPSITTNAPFCSGSTLTLDGSATDPSAVVSWMWSNNGSGTIANPSAQNTSATNPGNGETYTLTTTDPNGCTGVATETVGVVTSPTATISVNPSSACAGAPVTFTFTGTPNATVTYFDGTSNQITTLNGAGMATVNTTAGASNITYTLIDVVLGSCTATLSDFATVTIIPPPTVSISVNPMTTCQNTAVDFIFSGTPNATVTYFDGVSNQVVTLDGAGNATVPDFTGTTDITYTLVSVSLNGCTGSPSGTATVTVTPNPTATISVSPLNACPGELVTFTFSGTPNATITYDDGGSNNTITLDPGGFNTITIPLGSSDLTYNLLSVELNNCVESLTDAATVLVSPLPTATISVNPSSVCPGTPVTFTFTGTPNATVTYFDGTSNQTITLNGAGMATVNTTAGASNITYTLVDVVLGNCTATLSDFATVTIAPPPTVSISVNPMTACQNTAVDFMFSGTPNATVTYFNGVSNQVVTLDGTGNATVPDFTGTTDITYTLVSVSLNGCTDSPSGSATVTVTLNPTATISVSPSNACPGELVTFTFSGTPNAIINYNNGTPNNFITLGPTGFNTITVPLGSSDLTYTLQSVELNNCVAPLTDAATVFVSPIPTATMSAVPMFACEGDFVTFAFSGTPNAIVTFFNGSFNETLTLNASGFNSTGTFVSDTDLTYILLDVTLGACSQTLNDPVTVPVTPAPTANISVSPTTACPDEVVIFTFTGTPGATVTYDDGFGTQNVVLNGIGTADVPIVVGTTDLIYSLLDVTLNGCAQVLSAVATVNIAQAPTVSISASPNIACENENIIFTFTGTPNANVTYNDGISNQNITLDASGTAIVNATTGSTNMTFTLISATLGNCNGPLNGSATVTITPPPTASISVAPTTVCEGALATFTISGTPNADVSYTDPTGSQTVTLDATGLFQTTIPTSNVAITYVLTEVNLNNCITVLNEAATVDVTLLPSATISVTPTTACEGDPVTFTFTGTPNATITYNNGTTNTTVLLDNSGLATVMTTAGSDDFTYTLVNADFANCSQTLNDAATVSIAPTPTATVSATPISACEGEEVNFTFSGTPNAIITYNSGGTDQNIALDGSGVAILPLTLGNTNITITLVNALLGTCSSTLSNNATAMVIPTPIANPGSLSACDNGAGQATFDLTSINSIIGSGMVQWFDAIQAPIGNPANYTSGPTTIFATLTVNGCTSDLVAVSLTLDPLPVFNNLSDDCTASNLDYIVSFDISGGTAPYTVTGGTGTLTGTQFTSDPIIIGVPYSFFITDDNGCGPVEVSGNNLVCDCITDAGSMDNTPLNPCVDEMLSATHLNDETLDGDDILLFVLHDNAGNSLGTIYATNTTPDFDLSIIAGLMPNTLYYISAVAANDNGTGMVDETDLCISVSQGTPFIIQELPDASIEPTAFVCPLGCTSVMVTLTGTPPFSVDYEINHPITGVQMLTEVTNNAFFLVDVCGDDASNAIITITLNSISDAFCDRMIPLDFCTVTVGNNDATGTETYNGCQGDGYSVVVNNVIYNEATPDGTELITAFNGCDSLVTIDLNFSETLTGTESYVGCQGDGYSVVVNGETYDEATPSGMETVPSSSSCDSIVTIDLTFLPELSGTESYTGCLDDGYSVIVNGTTYDQLNTDGTETILSSTGCDSVVTITLVFNDILNGSETYTGCSGDGYSVVVNGETYDEDNPIGTETINSSSNCDSIVTINLIYNPELSGTESYNGCLDDGYSVVVNGTTYDQLTPDGTETITSSTGCDSIVTITLTFNDILTGLETYTGCSGDGYSVVVNGETYDESNPVGTESINSNSNCDSIVTINLIYNPELSGTESYNGCLDDGYSVVVNGTTYDQLNTDGTETITSSTGCDSIVTITLAFNDILTGLETYDGCSGDGYSVVVNGETYNEANPIGTETINSSSNCDSIVTINLSYVLPVTGDALHNGCIGDGYSITLNGNLYDESTPTGTETIPSSIGCDSIVTINLIYNQALAGIESHNGCIGDGYSVTVNGTIYNEGTPNGMETLMGTGGCDSIVTIALTFADILMGEENYTGCDGDGYAVTVNNVIYNQGNPTGTETLPSSGGCDSIVTINLVYNNILTGEENYNGCSGDGYTISVNGTIYNESNPTGTETLNSSLNCDSIVTVNLVFNESYALTNNYDGCIDDGYSIVVNGMTYDQLNTDGTENMLTINGCDSIIVIDLNFSDLLNGTESYNGCQGDGYEVNVNGTVYNEGNNSGAETLTSSNGCDSLVIINLVYEPTTFGTETHDGCLGDGYSILVNGTLYNEGNPIGTETIQNSVGCDSIITINLAFNNSVSGEETYSGCNGDGYEVIVNGTPYNEGNPTGMETLISGGGCDSIVTITLTFNSFLTGDELYTGCEGDGYQVAVGGTPYNEGNPIGTETLVSSIGCDSIVTITLTFLPELSGMESYSGCENDGYAVLVNGVVYNEGNPTGTETLIGSTGCDSIVTINLVFSNSLAGSELYTGCENDGYSVMVNGTLYNEANPTGTETLISNSSCDSIVMINLVYNPSSNENETYNGCIGDGYEVTVNGIIYNEGNPNGMETMTSSVGCDSIVNINLNFSNSLSGDENYLGCSGDGYAVMVNGTMYNEGNPSGMETLSTATCDSIVSINLIFNSTSIGSFERSGCEGDGFEIVIGGTLYNEANPTGTELLIGSNYLGCDSIVNIALSFTDEVVFDFNETLCDDQFRVINGTTYDIGNPTGTESIPGGSFAGCDSLINVNLAFYPTVTASLSATDFSCPGDSTPITFLLDGGNSYNVVFDNAGSVLNLMNIANGHSIMVAPTTTTTYSILAVSDPSIPCTPILQNSSVTISISNITVNATIQSDFDGFGVSCSGSEDGSALALAENGQAPYTYSWDNGTNGETTDNLSAGIYMVTATDAAGCSAETSVILTEPTLIQVSGMATAPACFGDTDGSIILDTIFGGSGPYEFSIDGQFFGSIDAFPYTIPFVGSGLQEVIIQDVNDCVVPYNTTVPTPSLNVIDLGGDQSITLGESYEIPTVTNFDIDTFFWSTIEFMDCDTCLQPQVSPLYTTMYAIQAVDANGCSAFNEITISVEKPRAVYIPNAFSPNGDASNENFTVYADQDEVVQVNFLRVFDRWGELVFQNSDFSPSDERIGWDGSFKGDFVQPGVFVYVAEVLFADGVVILYKGDLTVVK